MHAAGRDDRAAQGRAAARTSCRRLTARPASDARRPVRQHRPRLQHRDRRPRRRCVWRTYVVTEAGFGADLGAEKFMDIKCRMSEPCAQTRWCWWRRFARSRATAAWPKAELGEENLEALERGPVEPAGAHLTQHPQGVGAAPVSSRSTASPATPTRKSSWCASACG